MNVRHEKIKQKGMIKLPYMLDFYPLQDEKSTKVTQFFKNLKDGKLSTTKCSTCRKLLWPPRIVCPECLSDSMEWVDLGAEGELYAFTQMKLGAPLGFVEDLPFCIGIVRVGGLLVSARIDDAKYEDLNVGDKVRLKIVELEDGRVFYRFSRAKSR